MALIPVKWNWEDKLDKELNEEQNQKFNDKLCDILQEMVNQIFKAREDIEVLKERQNKVERQLKVVIKKTNRRRR